MAKPINITPTLRGRDALNFYKKLDKDKSSNVSESYIQEIRKTAASFKAIAKTR